MDNRSNMLQLCRLCLVKDDVNIPIFEEHGDIRQIFLKISSCLPVKVSREDKLPKKICDGCSFKLDTLYEFWNTSANAEKQLLTWLGEAGMNSQMVDGTISAVAQQIKPTDTFVKQETIEPPDMHTEDNEDDKDYMFQQKFEESTSAGPSATVTSNEEEEPPPPKRARRTAAVKAAIAMDHDSDDDDDSGEPMTKVEDESDESDGEDQEPSFADAPSTSADDQPGPSGVGKDGVEAPFSYEEIERYALKESDSNDVQLFHCTNCEKNFDIKHSCSNPKMACAFCRKHIVNMDVKKHKCFLKKYFRNSAIFVKNTRTANNKHRTNSWVTKSTKTDEQRIRIYRCRRCRLEFDSRNNYRKHLHQHHDEKYSVCPMCGKSVVNLSQHKNGVHGDPTSFRCSNCDKSFSCKKHLQRHMLAHANEFKHKCGTCEKGFKTPFSMRVHMRSHDAVKPFECSVCLKTFTTKQWRDNHLKTHRYFLTDGSIQFICVTCLQTFLTKQELLIHEENVKVAYDCDKCQNPDNPEDRNCVCLKENKNCFYCKMSVFKDHPKSHKCFHFGLSRKQFICLICWREFQSPDDLKDHTQSVSEYYRCDSCKALFQKDHSCESPSIKCAFCKRHVRDYFSHLCFHRKTLADFEILRKIDAEEFTCKICEATGPKKLFLGHYMKHTHVDCDICGKSVPKTTLRLHRSKMHQRVDCESCEKYFENNKDYVIHKKQEHLPRVCPRCGKQMATTSLKTHMMRCQNEDPQFKCESCGKCFAISDYLKRHMLVHSNECKHECITCKKRFKNRFNMRVHMRIHDEKKPFECSICKKTFTTKQWRDNHMQTHKAE